MVGKLMCREPHTVVECASKADHTVLRFLAIFLMPSKDTHLIKSDI